MSTHTIELSSEQVDSLARKLAVLDDVLDDEERAQWFPMFTRHLRR